MRFAPAIAILTLLSSAAGDLFAGDANPVADARSVVTVGNARFTLLTPQLARLEWSPDCSFVDDASFVFVNRHMPVPRLVRSMAGDTTIIRTDSLEIRYVGSEGRFTAKNLEIRFSMNGAMKSWRPGIADGGNLKGTTRTLDGVEGSTSLEDGLLSRDGWTVVDDSRRPLLDHSAWPWVKARKDTNGQDLYFFGYGHGYRKELYDFTRVAGKIPMPPHFAFGTWWSRYWAYTDEEFKDLVRQFHMHDVPLDVLVIDMDWHLTFDMRWSKDVRDQAGERLGWTGYTWDSDYFPDPLGFLAWCKKQGLKTTLNIHPASGIQPHERVYPEMAKAMGIDPSTKKYVPFDITNKKFATNYMDIVMHGLQKQGIDFFWLDWQQWNTTPIPGVTPTWWLNYVFFTDMEREGKARPLLFHRWGGLGNHRYQIGFSGDVVSVWPSLAFQPYFTATAANVGFGYWSHDIGGHMPGVVSPELYTRWIQFGVFSPILRTHTTKNPSAERRIWAYPIDDFLRMRDAFLLRYALIPYLYTESRRTFDTGVSICHPLYYDYPGYDEAYSSPQEYLFGSEMLVAPVATPLAKDSLLAPQTVWLPPGDWFEWFTGTRLHGPSWEKRFFALDEIPVFLRAGAIVPMQPKMSHTGEKPVDPLILAIAPGDNGATEVYEDAGNDTSYQHGAGSWLPISHKRSGEGERTVSIGPARGSYRGMVKERSYQVEFLSSFPPVRVMVNGRLVNRTTDKAQSGWWYDGDHVSLTVQTPSLPVSSKVTIDVRFASGDDPALVNGLRGKIARMKRVMPLLNSQWPREWSPDVLIHAAQTGDRMSIFPGTAVEEMKTFPGYRAKILDSIQHQTLPDSIRTRVSNHLTVGF